MPHFRDEEARSIIRDSYGRVTSESAAVAEAYYPPEELATLPREAVTLALGVGYPLGHAGLKPGESVLDLGCGAGIDTLLAARAVGPSGRAIGIDMTPEMVARARRNAAAAGLDNVEVREAMIEELPVSDASIDVVVSNGVLNLSTRKSRVLAETMRVLRPGGRLAIADLVLEGALPDEVLKSPAALAG
jgi:SAM-dependent methyltransferase